MIHSDPPAESNADRAGSERSSAATAKNVEVYDDFWGKCPDFLKYNPGVRHRRRWLLRTLQRCGAQTVLDVGCGTGELLRWLRPQVQGVREWTGVDLSTKTVASNREHDKGATYDALNIEEGALPRRFDAVLCTEVLEHLGRPERAMENLFAMVEPGGHLLLTCPTGKVHATEKHWGHTAHPSAKELRRLLERPGFAIEALENWGFPFFVALKYATNVSPGYAMSKFGTGAYSPRAKALSTALYVANFLNVPTSPLGCQLFALARRPR
ncbi:MAG: methyltransferase [Labilithrix sp.]|nr:methyltransferase [Labilithrix sp.]